MWNSYRQKHNHALQNPNRQRKKSGQKYKKTIDQYIKLLQRESIEWKTKWIVDARAKVQVKIAKYGVALYQIENALAHKWKKDLAKFI